MQKKKRAISHGEFCLFEIDEIPEGATRITPTKEQLAKNGFIVAPSETTGNHHCIAINNGVEFYEKNGTLYMRNTQPTKLFCVDEKRHDTIEIPATTWKGKAAKEVDHLRQIKRNVAD